MRIPKMIRMVSLLAVLGGILMVGGCGTQARPSTASSPAGKTWTTLWRDDFNGPKGAAASPADWQVDVGTCYPGCPTPSWGTRQVDVATNSPRNVSLDGQGALAINAIQSNGTWTSGRIETKRADFQVPPHGILRVEGRLQMPNVGLADGSGYWAAFWLLGAPFRNGFTGWPGVGELDAAEAVNGRVSTFAAMHCGTLVNGACGEPGGLSSGERGCPDCNQKFHRYAVEIDYSAKPQQVRWYRDDVEVLSVSANQMDPDTWRAATDHGFFVILNLAIGGNFPLALGGRPNNQTASERPLLVDYVSVSSWTNEQ